MCDCNGGVKKGKKKPESKPSEKKTCPKCKDKPKIKAKKASYVVVLDKTGNLKSGYPILEFEITDGCPNYYIDIQVAKEDSSLLSGGPGIAGAWDSSKPAKDRIKQKAFSSWSYGQKTLTLDGSGKATYKMPLEWWRDIARQPLSTFTTQKIYFRVVSACDATTTSTNDSSISDIEVQNNLIELKVIFKRYNHGGRQQKEDVKFTVREANTTDMYTIVQWMQGSFRLWGGTYTYTQHKLYNLKCQANFPSRTVDSLTTNPRPSFFGGASGPNVSSDGKTASGTDYPGWTSALPSPYTHLYGSIDFDTRVHLNYDVPSTVTVTTTGSAPIYTLVKGTLAGQQPLTLESKPWKVRILETRGVGITHPDNFTGP